MKRFVDNAIDADITGTIPGMPGIGAHTDSILSEFRGMVSDLQNGDATSVIRYINRGSIRVDVEAILGRVLDADEAVQAGRLAPAHIADIGLARACTIARELQAMRATARRTCQMYQVHGTGSKVLHSKLIGYLNDAMALLQGEEGDIEGEFETW